MLAAYRTYIDNPSRISDEGLTILRNGASMIHNILDLNTNVDNAPNRRLTRQRR